MATANLIPWPLDFIVILFLIVAIVGLIRVMLAYLRWSLRCRRANVRVIAAVQGLTAAQVACERSPDDEDVFRDFEIASARATHELSEFQKAVESVPWKRALQAFRP